MTSANKGFGCLVLFGGAFALAGAGSLLAGVRGLFMERENAWVGVLVGVIFLVLGLGIIIGGLFAQRTAKWEEARKLEFPNEPWRWRKMWEGGRVKDDSHAAAKFFWIFALFWNLVSFPIAFAFSLDDQSRPWWVGLLMGLFPLVGIIMLIVAIRLTLRVRKLGQSVLHLRTYPAMLGSALAGELTTGRALEFLSPVNLRLACVRQTKSGSGDDESTHESIQWEDEQQLSSQLPGDLEGRHIPIYFKLPSNQPQSDWSNSRDSMIWRLSAHAISSLGKYSAKFEVPVFSVANAPSPEMIEDSAAKFREVAPPMDEPTDSRVTIVPRIDGGIDIDFPAGRGGAGRFIVLVISLIFAGVSYGLIRFANEMFIGVGFAFFSMIGFVVSWSLTFFRSQATVARKEIIVRSSLFPFSWERRAYQKDVDKIDSRITTQVGDKPYYTITVHKKDQTKFNVGSGLVKKDAEWIIERIQKAIA